MTNVKVMRTTLWPNNDVVTVGSDFQIIPHLTGSYLEVASAVMSEADEHTIFELAMSKRGPMCQVEHGWK